MLIRNEDDLAKGLEELVSQDERLIPVAEATGPLPLRLRPGGFEGLANIIVSQQLSVASAAAIRDRLMAALAEPTAEAFSAMDDEALRACGLSRPKIRTLRATSDALLSGALVLDDAHALDDDLHDRLVAVKGIGPWTAEIYRLFCLGHADIFPAGDLALQNAIQMAFDLDERPDTRSTAGIAADWSPWRGVAARLFWAYYSAIKFGKQTDPV